MRNWLRAWWAKWVFGVIYFEGGAPQSLPLFTVVTDYVLYNRMTPVDAMDEVLSRYHCVERSPAMRTTLMARPSVAWAAKSYVRLREAFYRSALAVLPKSYLMAREGGHIFGPKTIVVNAKEHPPEEWGNAIAAPGKVTCRFKKGE